MDGTRSTQQLQAGQLLSGRYRIDSLLARGSMGEVYHAFDEKLERPVAVKTLPLTHGDNPQLVARFQLQARAAARIGHPGIVEIFDGGTEGDLPFVVMERLQGQSLRERIQERGPLDFTFVLRAGIDLTRAVQAAHKKGVIHRDLKPSNIFLAIRGDQSDMVKVLDFGVAKVLNAKALTQTGQVIGTLPYMAPEQLQSSKHVDARVDIYSIGCILYETLTGRPPFSAASGIELMMKVKHESPEPLVRLRRDTPDTLVATVERAMSKDRIERFANAALMADALCEIASRLGLSIPPQNESLRAPSSVAPAAASDDFATAPTVLSTPSLPSYETKSTVRLDGQKLPGSPLMGRKQAFYAILTIVGLILVAGAYAIYKAFR